MKNTLSDSQLTLTINNFDFIFTPLSLSSKAHLEANPSVTYAF